MTSLYATIAPHFTQDVQTPGLRVGYEDDGGVWQFVAPSLGLRLPLRAIEWKNLVGVTKTIDRLPVHFVSAGISGESLPPLVCIYVIKCEEMERYKSTVRAQIAQWIDRMVAAKIDWLLLYVPLGTRAKAGSAKHAGNSVYKKIFEKIKADFAHKRSTSSGSSSGGGTGGGGAGGSASTLTGSSANTTPGGIPNLSNLSNLSSSLSAIGGGAVTTGISIDRICKIEILEGVSVVGTQQTHEAQWTELVLKLRKCIMEAFEYKCLQYEEEVRVLDAKRSLSGWDFGSFFRAKERLALMYQQTYLLDDAIRHLDELEAIFLSLSSRNDPTGEQFVPESIFTASPFALDMSEVNTAIARNTASAIVARLYFFSRQIRTLYLMGDFRQLIARSMNFIQAFHAALLHEHENQSNNTIHWYHAHQWAVGACLEIAYACELSWSGHDYQISSASVPDGVAFQLTPEEMSRYLGDILYLARRVLKKAGKSNGWWSVASWIKATTDQDEQESTSAPDGMWYRSIATMFESSIPDEFQRCAWEVTHLASLHYSRAGRHRLAVFLGGECSRYHFRRREFESASRLLRSHARQCEEDKWWTLVGDCVRRICDSELALGRSAQAVAACFSMLEIAQVAKAKISKDYLDQLLSALVHNLDGEDSEHGVKMGELIQPNMAIETMQSAGSDLDYGDVRVNLTLANRFPAGIHIENVRIRFTKRMPMIVDQAEDDCAEHQSVATLDGAESNEALVQIELEESNVYLYERASVNLIFLYGDIEVGSYICTGLECSVAGSSFPLFGDEDLAKLSFMIPPRECTLRMTLEAPPLLSPTAIEELRVTIDTEEDSVQSGVLEVVVPGITTLLTLHRAELQGTTVDNQPQEVTVTSVISSDGDDTGIADSGCKWLLSIPNMAPHSHAAFALWFVVADTEADVPVAVTVMTSLRYEETATGKRHTELRRNEQELTILRPLREVTRAKRIGGRVFVSAALTCNPICCVELAAYAFHCHGIHTDDALAGDDSGQRGDSVLTVAQDLNDHLRGRSLLPNETAHMAFVLAIGEIPALESSPEPFPVAAALCVDVKLACIDSEDDGDVCAPSTSGHHWPAKCLFEVPLGDVHGTTYEIDVRPKLADDEFAFGENIVFTVQVRAVGPPWATSPPSTADELLLYLEGTNDADWLPMGKQEERITLPGDGSVITTTKRLLPMRIGHLRYPHFGLRRLSHGPATPGLDHEGAGSRTDSSRRAPNAAAAVVAVVIAPARIHCPQVAKDLLVV